MSPTPKPAFPGRVTATPLPAAVGAKVIDTVVTVSSGRMRMSAVTRGRIRSALFVILFGTEGIGKSTFGACAPEPIFLCSEKGTDELDVARLPTPLTWQDVLDAVDMLTNDAHKFLSLVIDTLDWIEPMLWAHICQRDGKENIEAYGFGKGYEVALVEWRILIARLGELQAKRKMNVIVLAHHHVKPFKNPSGADYERFEMKLHHKAAALWREASEATLFACLETFVTEKDGRTKAVSTGRHVAYTTKTAAFDAKNRYSLPACIDLYWSEFEAGVKRGRDLQDEVDALVMKVERLDSIVAATARDWLRTRPRTLAELTAVKEKLTKRLSGIETHATPTEPSEATATE